MSKARSPRLDCSITIGTRLLIAHRDSSFPVVRRRAASACDCRCWGTAMRGGRARDVGWTAYRTSWTMRQMRAAGLGRRRSRKSPSKSSPSRRASASRQPKADRPFGLDRTAPRIRSARPGRVAKGELRAGLRDEDRSAAAIPRRSRAWSAPARPFPAAPADRIRRRSNASRAGSSLRALAHWSIPFRTVFRRSILSGQKVR